MWVCAGTSSIVGSQPWRKGPTMQEAMAGADFSILVSIFFIRCEVAISTIPAVRARCDDGSVVHLRWEAVGSGYGG